MNGKTKVLIGDDSIEEGLVWAAMLKSMGVYVVTRQKNGRALLAFARSEEPDVIVIEAKMPELDAVEFIRALRRETVRLPIIIVVSNYDSPMVEREVMDAGAKYYMVKPFETKTLMDRILFLLGNTANAASAEISSDKVSSDMEFVVTDIIHQVGIPAHIKGYRYIRTAIMLSFENSEMINCVTKLLYPTVAKYYSTTSSRVERAIRHAIEVAWDRGDVDVLNSYFAYTIHTSRGKPTNSEFIALIADKLRLQFKGQNVNNRISTKV